MCVSSRERTSTRSFAVLTGHVGWQCLTRDVCVYGVVCGARMWDPLCARTCQNVAACPRLRMPLRVARIDEAVDMFMILSQIPMHLLKLLNQGVNHVVKLMKHLLTWIGVARKRAPPPECTLLIHGSNVFVTNPTKTTIHRIHVIRVYLVK